MGAIHYNAQPGTSDTALITVGAGQTLALTYLVAVNGTGGAVSLALSVHRAVSGVVETLHTGTIPATTAVGLLDDSHLALEALVLEPGDTLHGQAGAATSVTVIAFE